MKKLYSLFLIFFIYASLAAQPYIYKFNNTLAGNAGSPTLTEVLNCSATAGNFSNQAITLSSGSCGTKAAFNFTQNGGLAFDNTGGKIGATYTIHILFRFTAYTSSNSFVRIIDFSNQAENHGLYTYEDCLTLWDLTSASVPCGTFTPGTFYLLSIVRNGATDQFDAYVDGNLIFTVTDGPGYVRSPTGLPNTPIVLFVDDGCNSTQSGAIKYFSLNPATSTQAQVQSLFSALCTSSVLPLNLIDFSASKQNSAVNLNWTTENEFNVSHFEIERSADGQIFSKLADVASANTNSLHHYSFNDVQPLPGINFYRLKMIDIDGRFKYSGIIKISLSGKQPFEVYPNPAKEVITINGIKAGEKVKLLNAEGRILLQKVSLGQSMTIDVSKYPQGLYFVQCFDGEVLKNQKIIKQ